VELQIESSGDKKAIAADAAVVRLGRDPECEVRFDAAAFPKVSGLHAQFESSGNGLIVRPLSRSNATLLNGKPIDGATTIKRGDVLRLGYTGPEIRLVQFGPTPNGAPIVAPTSAAANDVEASSFPFWLWSSVAALVVVIATGVVMYRSMAGG